MAEIKPEATPRVLEKLRRSLQRALDAGQPAEKNYHVRTALQTIELMREPRNDD